MDRWLRTSKTEGCRWVAFLYMYTAHVSIPTMNDCELASAKPGGRLYRSERDNTASITRKMCICRCILFYHTLTKFSTCSANTMFRRRIALMALIAHALTSRVRFHTVQL